MSPDSPSIPPPSVQPGGELSARSAKENQAKIVGLAWFYLAESGLFKGYGRKNKKI
jgi:hypothetical protein